MFLTEKLIEHLIEYLQEQFPYGMISSALLNASSILFSIFLKINNSYILLYLMSERQSDQEQKSNSYLSSFLHFLDLPSLESQVKNVQDGFCKYAWQRPNYHFYEFSMLNNYLHKNCTCINCYLV